MKQTLIILGTVLLAIALAVVYFERKQREQNHKIASMFSLVSSLAEELNAIKYNTSVCSKDPETIHIGNQLIDVSDDEMELIEESSEASSEDEDELSETEDLSEEEEDEAESEAMSEAESEAMSEAEDLSEADSSSLEELDLSNVTEVKETKSNIKVLKLDLDSDSDEKESDKKTDYKKMSVGELRTLALQKGMDGAKLKKGELIELLSK